MKEEEEEEKSNFETFFEIGGSKLNLPEYAVVVLVVSPARTRI